MPLLLSTFSLVNEVGGKSIRLNTNYVFNAFIRCFFFISSKIYVISLAGKSLKLFIQYMVFSLVVVEKKIVYKTIKF